MRKSAILDTDFISKSYTVRTCEDDHLADRVLTVPEYVFFCHEQTTVELGRHFSKAPSWLETQIQEGRVTKYTDERIIKEMVQLYYKAGLSQYTAILRDACNAFNKDCFREYFGELDTRQVS